MRVAVIGAGIVGVTTAYELAADGHAVTVYERRGGVAAEASYANAGFVAPGYVAPWAAPGMPGKVLRHLFRRHAPVRFGGVPGPATVAWAWRWWRARRTPVYRANRARLQRLAGFSRERLHALTHDLNLPYERADGCLVLLRTPRDLELARPGLAALADAGVRVETLDAAGCRAVEPGLAPGTALHAGLYTRDDEVGNCRQFAHLMRREAERLGVRFLFGADVERIVAGARPLVVHVRAPLLGPAAAAPRGGWAPTRPSADMPPSAPFDAVVVCAALGAPALLRPLGLRLPLHPVHGYSLTAPLRHDELHPDRAPRGGLMDERYKVAISRLGDRIRVAGGAELGGPAQRHREGAVATLHRVLDDWFPGVARLAQAQVWKGARPMLPDGPPVLGASGVDGVWLNVGHGSSGWALACGSARVVADAVAGRAAPIDVEGLGVERLRG